MKIALLGCKGTTLDLLGVGDTLKVKCLKADANPEAELNVWFAGR